MMTDIIEQLFTDTAWPLAVMAAWILGEFGRRWLKIPRISIYAAVGFVLAPAQAGFLPLPKSDAILLLANIAFGLILFECGYRINLNWLKLNPWIGITSFTEASLSAGAVFAIASAWGMASTNALLLAALSMGTSPAAIVRVINEQRSAGQVTERALHLSALNCVLAVFAFKVILGFLVFQTSGSLWQATYSSAIVLILSVLLGAIMGEIMPAVLRSMHRSCTDSTLAYAIAIICLVAIAHSLKLSPLLAAITFGSMSRHRRQVINYSQKGFGALGDLLSVLLFLFVASALKWQHIATGLGLGVAIALVRQLAKQFSILAFAHVSGISLRKGLFAGLAMAPLSAFVILVLEQNKHIGIDLVDQLAPLGAAGILLELLGPVCTSLALKWSHESTRQQED